MSRTLPQNRPLAEVTWIERVTGPEGTGGASNGAGATCWGVGVGGTDGSVGAKPGGTVESGAVGFVVVGVIVAATVEEVGPLVEVAIWPVVVGGVAEGMDWWWCCTCVTPPSMATTIAAAPTIAIARLERDSPDGAAGPERTFLAVSSVVATLDSGSCQ